MKRKEPQASDSGNRRSAGPKTAKARNRKAAPDPTHRHGSDTAAEDEVFDHGLTEADDYFSFRSGATNSSGKSLREAEAFRSFDRKTLRETLAELASDEKKHAEEKKALMDNYEKEFGGWLAELHGGFSVLLSGVGSKRPLLDAFCAHLPHGSTVVSARGFQPGITVNDVLDTLCDIVSAAPPDDMSDASGSDSDSDSRRRRRRPARRPVAPAPAARQSFGSVHEQCLYIQQQRQAQVQRSSSVGVAARQVPRLYLVIHSIDGAAFRTVAAQAALSELATGVPRLHLIASCDHVNALQVWDVMMNAKFNWAHHRTPTYAAYSAELKHEDLLLLGTATGEVAIKGLHYILKSLTPNARGLFRILAEFQLENPTAGLSYKQFYEKCRAKFLVINDSTMRAQMGEFREHKVMLSRQAPDRVSYFYIPLDAAMLRQALEDCPT
eukprot:TRINITY_DN11700_c0_g1_i1.p1 TRINITY_DN11700_c0_g1~~TRINITY_DN11700_c0_g1_i1.p1  ORF type:complete len:439 (-),score=154.07 TRINITY_DN11700_c0_g1_i1:405-1721(-)